MSHLFNDLTRPPPRKSPNADPFCDGEHRLGSFERIEAERIEKKDSSRVLSPWKRKTTSIRSGKRKKERFVACYIAEEKENNEEEEKRIEEIKYSTSH